MSDARPLVSVVVPFYEPPVAFFREAVESALAQTYPRTEILLVDDGSRGESREMARQLAARHPETVRCLEHPGGENRGPMAARRLGLESARGQLVGLLDADDVWLPHKLEEQVERLRARPEAVMVYGNSLYWHGWTGRAGDAELDWLPALGFARETLVDPPGLVHRFLRGTAAVPVPSSVLARADVLRRVGAFDEAFLGVYEDQVTYSKVCLAAPVLVSTACWDRYRQHPESACGVVPVEAERENRSAFLAWLEAYLIEQELHYPAVWRALRRERWELRHPGMGRALRLANRALRPWRLRRRA